MYTMHYPFGLWLPVLVLALLALLLAGTAALAFMAFAVTGEALTTRERLIARMGRPLVLLGVLDTCLLLAGCAWLASIFWTPDGFVVPWRGPFIGMAFMLLHGAIMGAVVLVIWPRMESAVRRRVLLLCLGIIWLVAVVCGALLMMFPLARLTDPTITANLLAAGDLATLQALAQHLLHSLDLVTVAGGATALVGLGLTGAGLVGALWLLVRRRRDDFGRDYYIHTVRFCASKAAAGCWLLLAGYALVLPALLVKLGSLADLPPRLERLVGSAVSTSWGAALVLRLGADPLAWLGNSPEINILLPLLLVLFVLPALAALLFWRVSAAQIPLRHKLSLLLGAVLALATLWGDTFLMCLMV